jgi:hypothetical protein
MRYTLPIVDAGCAQIICHLVAYKSLTTVTEKFMGSTMLANVVLQHVQKLMVMFNAIYICDLCGSTNNDGSSRRPIIDGGDI